MKSIALLSTKFVIDTLQNLLTNLAKQIVLSYVPGLLIVTYHGWKKPEEKIRIVLLINREITRVTANIAHLFVLDDSLCSSLINFSIFYQRCQEKRRTNILLVGEWKLLQLWIYIQISTGTFVRQNEQQRAQS